MAHNAVVGSLSICEVQDQGTMALAWGGAPELGEELSMLEHGWMGDDIAVFIEEAGNVRAVV